MKNRWIFRATMLLLASSLVMAGCASDTVSKQEYSEPLQVMAAAEQAGAKEDGDAALHMQYAQENLDKANELIEKEDFDDARHYLAMAKADAQLALTLAEGKGLRAKVQELDERINKVRTDNL